MYLFVYIIFSILLLITLYKLVEKYKNATHTVGLLIAIGIGVFAGIYLSTLEHKMYLFGILQLHQYEQMIVYIDYFTTIIFLLLISLIIYNIIRNRPYKI